MVLAYHDAFYFISARWNSWWDRAGDYYGGSDYGKAEVYNKQVRRRFVIKYLRQLILREAKKFAERRTQSYRAAPY